MEKVLSKEQVKKRLDELRREGESIVFTNGCFDILHVGHVRYLQEAKKLGDILVLGLNSDLSVRGLKGEKRPLVPQDERADVLAALEAVDFVVIFDESTPLELIKYLKPDFLVKGGDWSEDDIVGSREIREWGGRVVVAPLIEGKSTTNVVEKILQVYR
ncbi:MAG: D-glycero-beta-D-manno-heptose 1-phosphate adenylyltransferase [Syntrophales bacterium]|nr:D-glycero-beta-D-manno-heptose 1-phosphate adenylyltransferase [Syntrophales bacterium]